MGSFKKLRRDCKHELGYLNKTDRCSDCNAKAPVSVRVERIHPKYQNEQAVPSTPVSLDMVCAFRIMALEMVLDAAQDAEENSSPIVSLQ